MTKNRHHATPQSPITVGELLLVDCLEAFEVGLKDLVEQAFARMTLSIAARRHAPEQGRLRAGRGVRAIEIMLLTAKGLDVPTAPAARLPACQDLFRGCSVSLASALSRRSVDQDLIDQ